MKLWLKDPNTNFTTYSVSLTLLTLSVVFEFVLGVLQILKKVDGTGPFGEMVWTFASLYFARRLGINGKTFSADKSVESKGADTNV